MAKYDDDLDFLGGGGPSGGERLIAALQVLFGIAIFTVSMVVMIYETDQSLESHDMHVFFTTFGIVLVGGIPIFVGGIMLFKRGIKNWKGEYKSEFTD